MHLIGSLTEDQFRKELLTSNDALQHCCKLRSILEANNVDLSKAYVVDWIPEQGEDNYTVLIGLDEIVHIEISHDNSLRSFERECLIKFLSTPRGRPLRIKLAVALDLVRKNCKT